MISGNTGFIVNRKVFSIAPALSPIHQIDYRVDNYSDSLYEQFEVEKPANLSSWVISRRAQFLAGRLAAKAALDSNQKIAHPLVSPANNQVLTGKHREPIWPKSVVGSISHSQQTSIAAVSKQHQTKIGLGVDVQSIIDAETRAKIAPSILTLHDEVFIKQGADCLSAPVLFTLIYSAKESFFKALFNTVGEYFDFDAVSIINIDTAATN